MRGYASTRGGLVMRLGRARIMLKKVRAIAFILKLQIGEDGLRQSDTNLLAPKIIQTE